MIRTLLYIFVFIVIGVVLLGLSTANAMLQIVFTPFFWIIVLIILVVMFFLERRGV
jgi:hypothetical protein